MWLKSKSSLNRERKKLVQTTVHRSCLPPTQHLLRRAVVLLTGPIALWVIARGFQEEGSQKIRVRGEVTVEKEQLSQEGGCCLLSTAEGLPRDPEHHRNFRCILIFCSLFTCISVWEHSCFLVNFLFVCLVSVCFSCSLARPFKITILALPQRSYPWALLLAFCSESNQISRIWEQHLHLHL